MKLIAKKSRGVCGMLREEYKKKKGLDARARRARWFEIRGQVLLSRNPSCWLSQADQQG